jgi:hypothetical protein
MSYRFRVNEQGNIVLQVQEWKHEEYGYMGMGTRDKSVWRDATVEDIPVSDPFRAPMQEPSFGYGQQRMASPALQDIG